MHLAQIGNRINHLRLENAVPLRTRLYEATHPENYVDRQRCVNTPQLALSCLLISVLRDLQLEQEKQATSHCRLVLPSMFNFVTWPSHDIILLPVSLEIDAQQ